MGDVLIGTDEVNVLPGAGVDPGVAGLLAPNAEETEVEGLTKIDEFLLRIEAEIAMADFVFGAIGEAHGLAAIGSDFP